MLEWNAYAGRLVGAGTGRLHRKLYGHVWKRRGHELRIELGGAPGGRILDHYRHAYADCHAGNGAGRRSGKRSVAWRRRTSRNRKYLRRVWLLQDHQIHLGLGIELAHRVDTYVTGDTAGGMGIGTNGILVVDFVPTGPFDSTPTLPRSVQRASRRRT